MNRTHGESKNYIFISYAHKDTKQVMPIIKTLGDKRLALWYDDSIGPGAEWDEDIAAHIAKCRVVLALISKNYLASKNCKDELNFARDMDKDIILIYLEDVNLPLGMQMRINRNQALFYHRRKSDRDFYDKLLSSEAVRACVGGSAPSSGSNDDDDDDDYVTLLSANGEEIKFVEIAGIAYKGDFYAILQPVELLDGMDDDEALVFKVTRGADGEDKFEIELDDDIIDEVFKIYDQLYDESHS